MKRKQWIFAFAVVFTLTLLLGIPAFAEESGEEPAAESGGEAAPAVEIAEELPATGEQEELPAAEPETADARETAPGELSGENTTEPEKQTDGDAVPESGNEEGNAEELPEENQGGAAETEKSGEEDPEGDPEEEPPAEEPETEEPEEELPTEEPETEEPEEEPAIPAAGEEAQETQDAEHESNAQESYSITFSNGSASFDTMGGTQVYVRDILAGLGYSVENAAIEVNYDSVDTSVLQITDTDGGPVLSDFGPFSRADRNLVVYIDGEAVELTVVDPADISGNQTAEQIEQAFSNVTDGNVKLTASVKLIADASGELRDIRLVNGTHALFLNNFTLDLSGMSIVVCSDPTGTAAGSVTLNIYGGAGESDSSGTGKIYTDGQAALETFSGGIINLNSGTVETKQVSDGQYAVASGITAGGGTVNIYDGTVNVYAQTTASEGFTAAYGVQADGGTVNIYGGTITSQAKAAAESDEWGYGIALMPEGIVNIHGGTVTAKNSGNARGVSVMDGTFNLYGGTVKAVDSAEASGIRIVSGKANIFGGTVLATGNSTRAYGIRTAGGAVDVRGGTIMANASLNFSGGVYVEGGTVNIYDGTLTAAQAATTCTVEVSDGTVNIYGGTLESQSPASSFGIGVTGGTANIRSCDLTSASPAMTCGIYTQGGTVNVYDISLTAKGGAFAIGVGVARGSDDAGRADIYGGTINASAYMLVCGVETLQSQATANIYGGTVTAVLKSVTKQESSIASLSNEWVKQLASQEYMETAGTETPKAYGVCAEGNSNHNIYGGTVAAAADSKTALTYAVVARKNLMTISGGAFKGDLLVIPYKNKTLVVTGGKFTADPAAYVSSGSMIIDHGTGAEYRYEVIVKEPAPVPADSAVVVAAIDISALNEAQKRAVESIPEEVLNLVKCTVLKPSAKTDGQKIVFHKDLLKNRRAADVRIFLLAEDGTMTEVGFEINDKGEIVIDSGKSGIYVIAEKTGKKL